MVATVHSFSEPLSFGVIYASETLEVAQRERENISLREGYYPTEIFSSPEGNLIIEPHDDWTVVWMGA